MDQFKYLILTAIYSLSIILIYLRITGLPLG